MTPPKHRASVPWRKSRGAWSRASGVLLAVVVAAAMGPTAYADKGFSTNPQKDGKNKPSKPKPEPKPEPKPQPGQDEHEDDGEEHGYDAGVDSEFVPLAALKPTAQPITAYQMPFPCDEVWTGSTRPGHSPSPRSVDFNRSGDQGAPVVAAAAGVVTRTVTGKKKPGYGQHVIVDHGNDESTMYAHLDSVAVQVGQPVEQGTVLGTVGNTGNSQGAHLHFEQRTGTRVLDPWFAGVRFTMGSSLASQNCGGTPAIPDVVLAGDLVGKPTAELVFFKRQKPATFVIKRSNGLEKKVQFGEADDQPVLGDWDGDGRANPAVRSSKTRTFTMRTRGKTSTIKFGMRGDLPIAGSWDGVGGWEVGVRRAGTNLFKLRSSTGAVTTIALGDADDLPVTGDWDGDGITDLGVYDPATSIFTLQRNDPAGLVLSTEIAFGAPGDVPVVGDWDGNGLDDLGVWNPVTGTFTQRLSETPTAAKAKVTRKRYGR